MCIRDSIHTSAGAETPEPWRDAYAEHGVCINSGKYDGLVFDEAVDAIASDLNVFDLGEKKVTWRLRDWGISRQRYWGTPIPIIHCAACGAVPAVSYTHLEVYKRQPENHRLNHYHQ